VRTGWGCLILRQCRHRRHHHRRLCLSTQSLPQGAMYLLCLGTQVYRYVDFFYVQEEKRRNYGNNYGTKIKWLPCFMYSRKFLVVLFS
jgi:hypothetical protein